MRKFTTILLYLLSITLITSAQVSKFTFPKTFNDTGTVYTYRKSNWDGSHASTIFLYVKDRNRLESFKYTEGDEYATLVSATINWKTYTVKDFRNDRIFKNGERKLIAQLQHIDSIIYFDVMGFKDSMTLNNPFWHSYDFDFASLGFTWRALKDPFQNFNFHIADAGSLNDKIAFIDKGQVTVKFRGDDIINGRKFWKYSIDGKGLQHKGGSIWINPTTFMIEQYKIELPDEESFVNGMLRLLSHEKMSKETWDKFISEKMN
jgi:hypothetical protein